MKNFVSLVDALDDLKNRGFTADFDLKPSSLYCAAMQLELHPDDFEIVEIYRFEGANSPDDSSILFAIEGKSGLKGVLVDAYGAYSDPLSTEMLTKIRVHTDQ